MGAAGAAETARAEALTTREAAVWPWSAVWPDRRAGARVVALVPPRSPLPAQVVAPRSPPRPLGAAAAAVLASERGLGPARTGWATGCARTCSSGVRGGGRVASLYPGVAWVGSVMVSFERLIRCVK